MKTRDISFKINILVLLISTHFFMNAQSLTHFVVANAGSSGNYGGISLDWTVGEPCITTLSNNNFILTQGFHQPDFTAIQTIYLNEGWSGISSWLKTSNSPVNNIFSQLSNNLIIVKNNTGLLWPAQNVNTLGNWDAKESFEIKVNTATSLQVKGTPLADLSFQLNQGWNYLPVLVSCDVPVADLVSGNPGVELIKGIATNEVYWPQFGINSIGNLHPGRAYFVWCNQAIVVTFTACSGNKSEIIEPVRLNPESCPWPVVKPSPITHLVAIPAYIVSEFSTHDFIGIFSLGQCVGVTPISDEILNNQTSVSLTAFADDPITSEKDGFIAGDEMEIRVFHSDSGIDTFVNHTWDNRLPDHENMFAINGLSALKNVEMLATGQRVTLDEIRVYPNPAKEFVNISWSVCKAAKVSFYNQMGELCLEIQSLQPPSNIDISRLVSGVYMVVISLENERVMKKLVVD